MPPAISTTSRPTAKMMLTELVFSRSKTLASVKKWSRREGQHDADHDHHAEQREFGA